MKDLGKTPRTVDQARDRIDSGQTGEKVDWPDPAASPLGTDAEAGGHPPTEEELAIENTNADQATPRRFALGAVLAYAAIACILLVVVTSIALNF